MKSVAQFTIAFIVVSLLSYTAGYRTGHTEATTQSIKHYGAIRQEDFKRHQKELMEVMDIMASTMSNALTRELNKFIK